MPQPRRHRIENAISRPERRLRMCEPRLALSASLAADFLLSRLEPDLSGGRGDSDWLLDQAEAVRQLYGIDGGGQTIAVVDSGAAWDHVALGGGFGPGYRVVGGWDFAENDADPYDDGPAGFHGTHVAGLIGGRSDGFTGVAPGADLVALRVFDDAGQGSLDRIEAALQWVHTHRNALDHPITTVNLSLGAMLSDEMSGQVLGQLEDELQQLHSDGIMVVAAAGNRFDPATPAQVHYPASSSWVAAVGSIDTSSGALSAFSQRENGILVAPGQGVRSSVPDHVLGWDGAVDDFVASNGTSMAAPQVAGAAALVRQAMLSAGGDATPATILQHLHATATTQTDPTSGLRYQVVDLQRAIESLLAPDSDGPTTNHPATGDPTTRDAELDNPLGGPGEPVIELAAQLGFIDSLQTTLEGDRWYRLQPSRSGVLSLQLAGEHAAEVVLRDADGATLAPLAAASSLQSDFVVRADQSLLVQVRGAGDHAVRLVNLLSLDGGRITLSGTDGNDTVRLDLSDGLKIDIHGAQYGAAVVKAAGWNGAEGDPVAIDIDGGNGSDTLQLVGSEHAERLVLRAAASDVQATGELAGAHIDAALRGFEAVQFTGGGGPDRATLYDTLSADTLHTYPGEAQLSGVGYAMAVEQVPRIYVHATGGGEDTAFLYDSAGDDVLAVRPQFTSLRGSDHFSLAYGFERVYAYATAGGTDRADLYDSAGDDKMTAAPTAAWISGSGYYASARQFETVVGHATAGGNDSASLYAQSDTATWIRTADLVQMNEAAGQVRAARGFEQSSPFLAGKPIEVASLSWLPDPDVDPRREAAVLADLFARLGQDP